MILTLPLPPGINHTYKIGRNQRTGRVVFYKDEVARAWETEAFWKIKQQIKNQKKPTGKKVTCIWYRKDKRDFDTDSPIKILLDILVKTGILEDDNLIEGPNTIHLFTKPGQENFCEVEIK